MIKCIIHCADIHIRNFQRQEEYAEQLTRFIDACKDIASNYDKDEVRIVVCGDLGHSKIQISNEYVSFASTFLRELSEVAKVIVISGNHDILMNNMSRKDTLTALFETADFDNCVFLDMLLDYQSGCVDDDGVVWALYSIFDGYARPNIEEAIAALQEDKKVIGLYHGSIVGARLDNGVAMESGVPIDRFEGCDAVICGDIHKRQCLKCGNVDVVYSGSLIQQNMGESVGSHGFVVWDVETLKWRFVDLPTEYGIYKVSIGKIEDIDNDNERLLN